MVASIKAEGRMKKSALDGIDLEKLGKRLSLARKARKMTQGQASQKVDMARTTLTAIEKGARKVSATELINFALLYGKQVRDFLLDEDDPRLKDDAGQDEPAPVESMSIGFLRLAEAKVKFDLDRAKVTGPGMVAAAFYGLLLNGDVMPGADDMLDMLVRQRAERRYLTGESVVAKLARKEGKTVKQYLDGLWEGAKNVANNE